MPARQYRQRPPDVPNTCTLPARHAPPRACAKIPLLGSLPVVHNHSEASQPLSPQNKPTRKAVFVENLYDSSRRLELSTSGSPAANAITNQRSCTGALRIVAIIIRVVAVIFGGFPFFAAIALPTNVINAPRYTLRWPTSGGAIPEIDKQPYQRGGWMFKLGTGRN